MGWGCREALSLVAATDHRLELGSEEDCWSERLPVPPPSLTWYKQPEEFGSMAENAQPEELGRDYERRTELMP